MALAPNTENLTLGKGVAYFDRLDADGNPTGELDLGNCVDFPLRHATTLKEHFSSRGGVRKRDLVFVSDEKFFLDFSLEEYSKENIILAICGDAPEYLTQSAGSATKTVTAYRGRWLELGFRAVSNVSVTHGATTFSEIDDYLVDLPGGRIMPLSNGAIYEKETLLISFDYAAISQPVMRPSKREVSGLLRFVSKGDVGRNWELKAWRAKVRLREDIQFITSEWGRLELVAELEAAEDEHPGEPYFTLLSDEQESSSEPPVEFVKWKFDEGSGLLVADSGVNGCDGTWAGTGAHWSGAYGFWEKAGDRVVVAHNAYLAPTAAVTIGGWINKAGATTQWDVILRKEAFTLETFSIGPPYTMKFYVKIGSSWKGSAATAGLTYGVDYHVVGVYDGAKLHIYVNGVEVGTGTAQTGAMAAGTGELWIGDNPSSAGQRWSGKMKDVRLYNYALTATEVLAWYNE